MTQRSLLFVPSLIFVIASLSWAPSAGADTETPALSLDPIVVHGSSADVLLYDPVVPTRTEQVAPTTTQGSIVGGIETELPIIFTDDGEPGTLSQLRGLGRTVEDMNVQTLGVTLNPAEGGGFDFSTFPQFFWSKYSLHLGPSTGGFDPRASTGTLTLLPWTADALQKPGSSFRLTQMVTRGLAQTSVAGHSGDVALLTGLSEINTKGLTNSVSVQLARTDKLELRAHFLETSLDETSPGSTDDPSPDARLKTNRDLPILETSYTPSPDLVIKDSLFYDWNSIRFVNPDDHSNDSYDRSTVFGTESVVVWKDWTVGGALRHTSFQQVGGDAPDEEIAHLQLGRVIHWGAGVTSQASAQGDWINLYGARPGGTLGTRMDINERADVFAKINYTYRFPTIEDRYSDAQAFLANPNLPIESALSLNLGGEWKDGPLSDTLQGFLQFRRHAQLLVYESPNLTVIDGGSVRQLSAMNELGFRVTPVIDLTYSLRLSSSYAENTGERIPYDPLLTQTGGVRVHAAGDDPDWGAGATARNQTSSPSGLGATNSPYTFVNLDADFRVRKSATGIGEVFVQGRVENLMGQGIQVVQNYPWPGRLFGLSVIGTL